MAGISLNTKTNPLDESKPFLNSLDRKQYLEQKCSVSVSGKRGAIYQGPCEEMVNSNSLSDNPDDIRMLFSTFLNEEFHSEKSYYSTPKKVAEYVKCVGIHGGVKNDSQERTCKTFFI